MYVCMRKHGVWSKSLVYDLEAEQVHHRSSHERTNLGLDKLQKTSQMFPTMEKEGIHFMQRSCNDQSRPGVCLSMHLSVVG